MTLFFLSSAVSIPSNISTRCSASSRSISRRRASRRACSLSLSCCLTPCTCLVTAFLLTMSSLLFCQAACSSSATLTDCCLSSVSRLSSNVRRELMDGCSPL